MKKDEYHLGKTEPFFPDFLFKEALAALIFFIVIMLIVAFSHVPMEALADPTDSAYIPRPEWYFMFLFQLLKYFPGALEPVAVIVLPTIAILALTFLPFLDRSPERRALKRPFTTGIMILALIGMGFLTMVAIETTPPSTSTPTLPGQKVAPVEAAGKKIYQDSGCGGCHSAGGVAPTLAGITTRRDAAAISEYVKNPKANNPSSMMPAFDSLTPDQMDQLIQYLGTLK